MKIPEGWECFKIKDLCEISTGLGFKEAEYVNQGIKLFRIENVSYEKIDSEKFAYLPYLYKEKHKDYDGLAFSD